MCSDNRGCTVIINKLTMTLYVFSLLHCYLVRYIDNLLILILHLLFNLGTPCKKVKILCGETPLKKRSSNRLLNTIRNEQKKCGIIPNTALVVLESPQRDFYSESSTLSWRQMPNDKPHLTPEKNSSVFSVFHSPLLAYRSVPLQHIESPFKLPFDSQSNRPVLELEYDGFIFNSTPNNNCIISPTITSNCKIDMFVTPTKYST